MEHTPEQLQQILSSHAAWLKGEKEGVIANLCEANLSESDLLRANLRYADLYGANLSEANLSEANLRGVVNLSLLSAARLSVAQPEGEVIGWKKCLDNIIVKLKIPPQAKRSNATGRKCRAEFAEVLEVIGNDVGLSAHDYGKTQYRAGEIVKCDSWDENRWNECSGGIHFYITKEEAEAH